MDDHQVMENELRNLRNVEVGTVTTRRRRGGRIRTRQRLWINLHTEELDRLKHQAKQRQVSVSALIRWAMQQPYPEAALQSLTGIPTEEILEMPATPSRRARRDSAGWRRRTINWQ